MIPEPLYSIVDTLTDFPDIMFIVPMTPETVCNACINTALPQMWNMVKPFITAPCDAVTTVTNTMAAASDVAFANVTQAVAQA